MRSKACDLKLFVSYRIAVLPETRACCFARGMEGTIWDLELGSGESFSRGMLRAGFEESGGRAVEPSCIWSL